MSDLFFAVDLGSTTIDMSLLDKNEILANGSIKNRQSLYGSDVINRILNSVRNRDNLLKMKEMVLEDITNALRELLIKTKRRIEDVSHITISGNTTMISILLEYDLEPLGHAPFERQLVKSIVAAANKYIAGISEKCIITFTGCASAFIGGDILSGLMFLEREYELTDDKNYMLIDLGTNGEIVLNSKGKMYGTSTACGPAFEGCTRRQGVYGSNTIDAICLAVKTGKLSREGVLAENFFENGLNINGVSLNMDILREILMAKAAIYSGIEAIMNASGTGPEMLDYVFLAGGFGSYLNIENAISIGLLPASIKGKIKVVGNTSLRGCMMLARDRALIDCIDSYTEGKINIIQLADNENYKDSLINNMHF
ncbi:MAG: ASKHA domain-containing protein [Wujia sp.]